MSEFEISADCIQGANIFIKKEPQLVDLCSYEDHRKPDLKSHGDINCDEKFVSQAGDNISSCFNLDNIKYDNLKQTSSFSSYVDQDFKPNIKNELFDLKPHSDSSIFQKDVSVTGCDFQEEKLEENVETKFNVSEKYDCYHIDSDASFEFKTDIDVRVKKEIDNNSYCNKEGQHLLGNTHFTPFANLEKLMCQCNEENNQIKEENISIVSQSSFIAQDTDIENKSITTDVLKSSQRDHNTITKIEESSYDYHSLLFQENLSNNIKKDEDPLIDNNQGITLMNNSHMFGAKNDLLSGSSSSVHGPHAQPHKDDPFMKNRQSCESSFQCLECFKCFNRKSILIRHEISHKGLKPFQCSECSKYFAQKASLKRHEITHKGLKPFKCSQCSKCFTKISYLMIHERIHNGLKPYQCSECSKCFTNKSTFTQHEKIHKGLSQFKCSECSKCFTRKSYLTVHERIHNGVKPYQCSECSKCFTDKSTFTKHEKIHKGLSPFKCSECSKCFTRKSHLTQHEDIHKGLNPFQCLECPQSFSRKSNLIRHEKSHISLRPFKCSECSKCFTRKSSLIQHEMTHRGLKPFQCFECSKSFCDQSNLIQHKITHMDLRPFKCSECCKCFKLKTHLTQHEITHKDQRPFKCSKCSRCFKLKAHLTLHEITHNDRDDVNALDALNASN